ncbi:MAG: tetratricopeptide repeat protein [Treponema sp.]|nr:tetratricopeptide repeat protein [Treponema sp.]
MNITIERPSAVYALLLLIPALIITLKKYFKLLKLFKIHNKTQNSTLLKMKRSFFLRTLFRSLAWISIVAAYAGISWGINTVPVQKTGKSISLVFDISYSMLAKDGPASMTRLEAACNYCEDLLEHINDASISVTLAKGDGVLALPMTEDINAVSNLLSELSPNLITSQGSSLGGGINAAIKSFPPQSSHAGFIWLFTDCEETDDTLLKALSNSVREGYPVAIIGFGNEIESEVLAGDGKTRVKTALRSAAIEKMISTLAHSSENGHNSLLLTPVTYIDASQYGSASHLLKMIEEPKGNSEIAYEIHSIQHHNIFIMLAILFFVISVISGEIDITSGIRKMSSAQTILLLTFMLTSCSDRFNDGKLLFQGKLGWNRKDYQSAIACFLEVADDSYKRGDKITMEYALCNLATTYLMQDENDIALKKFSELLDNATEETSRNVKFTALYNSGIIAHRQGNYEKAVEYFKSALLVDSTSTAAKINLELSIQEKSIQKQSKHDSEVVPVSENNYDHSLEEAIYSIIKEEEKNQWKSQQQQQTSGSSLDY